MKNFNVGMNYVTLAVSLGNADAQALLNAQAKSMKINAESIAKGLSMRFTVTGND